MERTEAPEGADMAVNAGLWRRAGREPTLPSCRS